MRIQIRRIRPEGMEIQESFPVEAIGMAQTDVLQFVSPFEMKAKVVRVDDEVLATIMSSSCYTSLCSRCLEEVKQEWATSFTLTFEVKEHAEFIEMDEDIRQELILNLPGRILCQADCRGLCIDCGANLNKQQCNHKHAVISG